MPSTNIVFPIFCPALLADAANASLISQPLPVTYARTTAFSPSSFLSLLPALVCFCADT